MLKRFSKYLSFTILGIFLIIILPFIISPIVNNIFLYIFSNQLKRCPIPKETKFIEQKSVCGKLNGNGNGMNFLSSMVVKSDLSFEELEKYYKEVEFNSAVDNGYEPTVYVIPVKGEKLDCEVLEHREIYYESLKSISNYNDYYIDLW